MLKMPTIKGMPTMISRAELLERDLYTYANYEEIAEKVTCMKESKEFYGMRILETLEATFQGKSKEEIRQLVNMLVFSVEELEVE